MTHRTLTSRGCNLATCKINWLRHELFVLSPVVFAAILILQQIFDASSTIYLTSFPVFQEANPILAPMWNAPGGVTWLISVKFWMCILIGLGVPYVAKEEPRMMWSLKFMCLFYWLVVFWNGYLIATIIL